MTLPNAHKGVKKLFIAEILQLIGVALILGGTLFYGMAVGAYQETGQLNAAASGFAVTSMITLFGGALLPIIAYIMSLVGLKQASKDEPDRMKKAFWCAIAALILTVVASLLQSLHWGGAPFFTAIASILEICMMVFSIMGVSEVTQNIAREDVADMGPKILTVVVVAMAIALIASLLGPVIGGIAGTISLVLMFAAYVIYLMFLGKATSALAQG